MQFSLSPPSKTAPQRFFQRHSTTFAFNGEIAAKGPAETGPGQVTGGGVTRALTAGVFMTEALERIFVDRPAPRARSIKHGRTLPREDPVAADAAPVRTINDADSIWMRSLKQGCAGLFGHLAPICYGAATRSSSAPGYDALRPPKRPLSI